MFSSSFFLGDKMGQYFENEKLPSKMVKTQCFVLGKKFVFYTDNGVFSKKKLDYGTRLLIESVISEEISGNALDVGCGYGVIGVILSSFLDLKFDFIDVNRRALHLTEMNMKENKITGNAFYSNIYENVTGEYNAIISNPPIRAGKDIVYKILFDSKNYLVSGGALYFVINKNQGAKSVIKDLNKVASINVLKKDKGFFVIKCIFD